MNYIETLKKLNIVFSKYRTRTGLLIALGFVSSFLEGLGINIVIPLLSSLIGGIESTPLDFLTSSVKSVFDFLSIPFTFRYILGLIFLLFMFRAVTVVYFAYVKGWIAADYMSQESQTLFRAIFRARWSFLLKQKIGYMQTTLVRDVQRSSSALEVMANGIQSFTGFLMYLLVALNISPMMTLVTLVGGGVLVLFLSPFVRNLKGMWEKLAETEKDISQFLTEHIVGMKTVKAAGVYVPAFLYAQKLLKRTEEIYVQQTLVRKIPTSLFQPFSLIFVMILFFVTYETDGFNLISFGVTLYLISKIFVYLESGQSTLHSMAELMPYIRNVSDFKAMVQKEEEQEDANDVAFSFTKKLEAKNIMFAHEEGKEVLSGINFELSKGETVGIIGPSGAGKTSVADILLRLLVPSKGELLLDGVNAQKISLSSWRSHIGYVSQDVFLINGSVIENIRFYREEATEEEIMAVLKEANALQFVQDLPQGLHTTLGDRGVTLSGGQRQRIALARALVGKPQILILDEATSALDHESEQLIQESIKKMHGHTTMIIIAHRPSTVADADKIFVLDKGKVVEQGTPAELLSKNDSYFFSMQNSNR